MRFRISEFKMLKIKTMKIKSFFNFEVNITNENSLYEAALSFSIFNIFGFIITFSDTRDPYYKNNCEFDID